MTRNVLLMVCLAVQSSFTVAPVAAQTGGGELTGIVRDQGGAAVPGAIITVAEARTNRQRVAVSTGDGVYTVARAKF